MSELGFFGTKSSPFTTARRASLDSMDMPFVVKRLRAGVPHAAVARMVGCSVAAVTRAAALLDQVTDTDVTAARTPFVAQRPEPEPLVMFRGIPSSQLEAVSLSQICQDVADKHGIPAAQLRGVSRERRYAHPRQEAYWLARKTGRYSLSQIGRFFGGRDHTTVLHGIRAYEARKAGDAA